MEEKRKVAYRWLLYHAMLEIRLFNVPPPVWRPLSRRRWRRHAQKSADLADAMHNLAQYSAWGFEGFVEDDFWRDMNSHADRFGHTYWNYRVVFESKLGSEETA